MPVTLLDKEIVHDWRRDSKLRGMVIWAWMLKHSIAYQNVQINKYVFCNFCTCLSVCSKIFNLETDGLLARMHPKQKGRKGIDAATCNSEI